MVNCPNQHSGSFFNLFMKKTSFVYALAILICACSSPSHPPVDQVQQYLVSQADSLDHSLQAFVQAVQNNQTETELQQQFQQARIFYKHLEPFTELYFPGFSEMINGPAIDEMEPSEGGKVTEATGFQVVEEYLYPLTDSTNYKALLREATLLGSTCARLKQLIDGNQLTDEHIFQATRLELLRISSLGLSGFDSPVALRSLPEAAAALRGIEKIATFYHTSNSRLELHFEKLKNELDIAEQHLALGSFDTFDRGRFISGNIRQISEALYEYQLALGINNREFLSALDLNKAYFMEPGAFQTAYFTNPLNRNDKPEIVELGKLLFFDPVLSGNNQRSCASCHHPSRAFTDNRKKSLAFEGKGEVARNAPSLINSVFQRMQFYDSRVMFLEDQIKDVLNNPTELHGQLEDAIQKIKKSEEYSALFGSAFNSEKDPVSNNNVQHALASYIASLNSMNSPFDRYMRGEESAMSEEALKGFTLFMGKAKCGTCHFMPLFNGTVPPLYTKSESEVLGVPANTDTLHAISDPDLGKYLIYGGDLNRNAFKTPTVRNAALTMPYMHNGVYPTLEDVIDFYNRGGGEGINIHLENQTLPTDPLNLTSIEKRQLILFMKALTDTSALTTIPATLPVMTDPKLKNRKVGGLY